MNIKRSRPRVTPQSVSEQEIMLEELLTRGRRCVVQITGDPDDALTVTSAETAWRAIDSAIQLRIERNDELNALRLERGLL